MALKQHRYDHLCPHFQAAMEILARPWNGLIIATLEDRPTLRFSELRERLTAMGDRMLSSRLKELEARGLVVRHVSPGPPVRVEYALTSTGRRFRQVERAISDWGQALAATAGPPGRSTKPTRPRRERVLRGVKSGRRGN
jgi:DNA-binding HxlR family transcriptional regulator